MPKLIFRSTPSIRARLTVLVSACVFPAALMAVILISYDYHRAHEQLVANSVATARTMASLVDKEFASVEATLRALATSPSLTANDLSAFSVQVQDVLSSQTANNIVLADPSGKQYVNMLRPFGEAFPQHDNPTQLGRLAATNGPVISELLVGGVSNKPIIAIGIPVRRNSKHIYNLSAGISPDLLANLLAQQHLPPDWIGAVLDSTGTIIARTHDMKRFLGTKGTPNLLRAMAIDSEGASEGVTKEGIPVLAVFSRSAVSNWSVAIGIPSRNLTAELHKTLGWLIFAIISLLASSLWLTWLIGGKIAQSVRGLTEPALALGSGKDVVIPPLHVREADEVGKALLKASEMLRHAQHRANHDVLTGLANRVLFKEILNQQLSVCERNGTHLSVLYIDLDGFKTINDTHGHAAGDRLLRDVAGRIKAGIRESDLAARMGGDEFAVVLIGALGDTAMKVAEKLVETLSKPYAMDHATASVTASIGVAGYPECGSTSKDLLRLADAAMYQAKKAGKRRVMSADTSSPLHARGLRGSP